MTSGPGGKEKGTEYGVLSTEEKPKAKSQGEGEEYGGKRQSMPLEVGAWWFVDAATGTLSTPYSVICTLARTEFASGWGFAVGGWAAE